MAVEPSVAGLWGSLKMSFHHTFQKIHDPTKP